MDQFFKASKSRVPNCDKDKKRSTLKYHPYSNAESVESNAQNEKKRMDNRLSPPPEGFTASSSAITKLLLSTLSDESNPITHSDIGGRADHVSSISTGHQVAESRGNRRAYMETRAQKLANQTMKTPEGEERQVLRQVRVYINGFLSDTTDIEMKRIVTRAGGQIVNSAAGATHILTSQQLSGSKTHKILTTKSRRPVHVVRPEWITDSIKVGKRRPEREYSVIKMPNMLYG